MNTPAPRSWRRRAILGAGFGLLWLFYLWTVATSDAPALPGKYHYFNNHLADAFIAGQLNLLIQPKPELLALPDPYDPVANEGLRHHDTVLFNKKYYLYYGPVPALLMFAPFRLVAGFELTEPLAAAFLASLGVLFAFLFLHFLYRTYLPDTPFWLIAAAIPAIGFGSVMPFLLRRPVHYEVAIAGGHAFAFASAYFFVAGTLGARLRPGLIALGSLMLGLAGGTRFPMFGAGLIAVFLAVHVLSTRREEDPRRLLLSAAALVVPAGVCLFLLLLYNYLRFDSWTEFGIRYTLQGYQSAQTYKFYSVDRVWPGLYYYLFSPPRLTRLFPFILLDPAMSLKPPAGYFLEPVCGFLIHSPIVGSLWLLPMAIAKFRRPLLGLYLACGASLMFGAVLLLMVSFAAGTMRYEVDFATFFLIPALFLWYGAYDALKSARATRWCVAGLFLLLLALTIIFNTAFSLVGYYDNLKQGDPATYAALQGFFRPLEHLLARIF